MNWRKPTIWGAGLALVCALTAIWALADREQPESVAKPAEWGGVARGRVDVEGGIVKLAAQRDGVIKSVPVGEGDQVRAGQVLAVLDDEQARLQAGLAEAEYRAARAEAAPLRAKLTAARREVERLQQAVSAELAPGQSLDTARDDVAALQAELGVVDQRAQVLQRKWQVAEHEVSRHTVRAPSDGQIVRRDVRPGDGVSTLNVTPLFLFAPARPRVVRAEFEERFIAQLKPGSPVEIALEVDESRKFAGRLLRLSPAVGLRTRSDDPAEKQDVRVVEAVVALQAPQLLIGQRVIVRLPAAAGAPR